MRGNGGTPKHTKIRQIIYDLKSMNRKVNKVSEKDNKMNEERTVAKLVSEIR